MPNDDEEGGFVYGFRWGPVVVERTAITPTHHVIRVNGLNIWVSPTGRNVRVFKEGKELKPDA